MDIVTVSCATSMVEVLEFYCDRVGLTSGGVGLILCAVGALQAIFAMLLHNASGFERVLTN